jgi:hypothetical protein
MTINDYYRILDLPAESTLEDIKKAYRKKARLYHPDINPDPDAKEKFIIATQAYEFLIAYHDKIRTDMEEYQKAMEDWRKYRQDRSRRRANAYAHTSYNKFRNTSFYKTTRIFDGTAILFSLIVSVLVLVLSVTGYLYRLHNPVPGQDNPTLFSLVLLVMLGMVFFIISIIYLKAYRESSARHKKRS